jgi:hypothetical protein
MTITTAGTWYPPSLGTGGFLHEGQLFINPPFRTMSTDTITADDLALHAQWLSDSSTGKRLQRPSAYLTRANLTGADLTGADLSGAYLTRANLTRADLSGANLSGVIGLKIAADAPARLLAVARAALQPGALYMNDWHTCETTHCISGWAVHLAGEVGCVLETAVGVHMAGLYLLGVEAAGHFYDTNKEATKYLQSVIDAAGVEVGL